MNEEMKRLHDERPWGSFDQFTENAPSTVKLIRVSADKRLSLQRHQHRAEFWHCVSGSGTAEIDGVAHALSPGSEVFIPVHAAHRMSAGNDGLTVLEIAFGQFDEGDIERLADDFGRAAP